MARPFNPTARREHNPPASRPTDTAGQPQSNTTLYERLVVLEDDELVGMAMETKRSIDWRSVILSARHGPAPWKRDDIQNDFMVYTRLEPSRFAVFAVGLVPGCVAEILNVLQSPNSAQHAQQMAAVFQGGFRDGAIVHRVDLDNTSARPAAPSGEKNGSRLAEVTVKHVAFQKSGWLANHEAWCYLDAVYRSSRNSVVEKFMTTMEPNDVLATASSSASVNTNAVRNVVCGLNTTRQCQTRVCFYGEYLLPQRGGFSLAAASGWRRSVVASDKTIKQRLVKLAHSTARLTTLVRRQRLGLQVLADTARFLPPTNAPCTVCTRMLFVAKLCRVCGQGVCGDCSAKHERVRQATGDDALEVTQIRVCAHCLERIDQAEYANLTTTSVLGTHVVSVLPEAKPASEKLSDLFRDALLSAGSPSRQSSVKSVIRSLRLDRESSSSYSSLVSSDTESLALSSSSHETDFSLALDDLHFEQTPANSVTLRSDDHRSYRLDTSGSAAVPTPVPDDEALRLQSVRTMSGSDLATVVELEILCELAAREMKCATSAISLVDRDEYYGVASNAPALRNARIPRTQTICSHTMMERETPLLVAHPEADIRFSKFDSVKELGVRFYCAFPLIGDDNQVIGTMCCLNGESLEVTTSQIANFKRLAATASRVMRVETRKRQRKASAATSETESQP